MTSQNFSRGARRVNELARHLATSVHWRTTNDLLVDPAEPHPQTRGTTRPNSILLDLMDEICALPRPLRSHEDWERFNHVDLANLTIPELLLESDRVRLRLQIDRSPDEWLLQRLDAVERVIADARTGGAL